MSRSFPSPGLLACVVAAILGWGSGDAAAQPAPPRAKFEPPDGCYIGAYVALDDASGGDMTQFERLTAKKHASYFRYAGYGQPFPSNWVAEVKAAGAVPHIAWEPNDGLAPVKDDAYLRQWAADARDAGCPIFLRYASEMNGNWQAYSGNPRLYIEKWRLVHKVMSEVAPNVAMVWCPFAEPVSTIDAYYPGDAYVDWVGVNIYSVWVHDNDPTKPGGEDPLQFLDPIYLRYADRKPVQICEYAATHFCLATKQTLSDFATEKMTRMYQMLRTKYPRVKMINWFSVDTARKGLASNDYAVTSDPAVLERYRALIADGHFLSNVVTGPVVVVSRPSPGKLPGRPEDEPEPMWRNPLKYIGPQPDTGVNLIVRGSGHTGLTGKVDLLTDVGKNVRADLAMFRVDGEVVMVTTVQPFRCIWDTTTCKPGDHAVEVTLYARGMREAARRQITLTVSHPDEKQK